MKVVGLKITAMAGNRTQVNCLEGSYAYHYTTIATKPCGIWLPERDKCGKKY